MKLADIIVAETEDWIAINKPSGLLSIPDREGTEISLKKLLLEKFETIFTVHRLDKDTSGLIVFAKNEETHKLLSLQFKERQTEKFYQGLLIGSITEKEGVINAPIAENQARKGTMQIHHKGKESITEYTVLTDFKIFSWVQFQIHTGRTHQIRVHAKHLGHPVVCDTIYGDGKPVMVSSFKSKFNLSKNEVEERPILNRLALHAFSLKFSDMHNVMIRLVAPLPKDLKATLQQLDKWKLKK